MSNTSAIIGTNPASARALPSAIDLFSGCGGLTLGLKLAGFQVIGAVEIDLLSVETYEKNHPGILVFDEDIKKVTVDRVKCELGLRKRQLDLLAGCPPCQGFSTLRTLNGGRKIIDSRNRLIFEMLRFVEELKPKAVMMENVPGMAMNHRYGKFKRELKKLGYKVTDDILNTADYGVPQRRRRLVLMASRFGKPVFPNILTKRVTVRERIGDMLPAGESGDALHDYPERHSKTVMDRISRIPKDGGSRLDLGSETQLECHKGENSGFKDVYGRMSWSKIAPTITTGCFNPSKGRFLHPEENRAITLREAALLQGFPADYYFSLRRGKSHAASLIGNAMPPEFVRMHAEFIKHCIPMRRRKDLT